MNFYLDTEFMADANACSVKPLSIALVAETGESLYLVISDAPREEGNEFVQEFVVPFLDISPTGERLTDQVITDGIYTFGSVLRKDAADVIKWWVTALSAQPQFWAWYASYDWVCFCDLLGGFLNVPVNWPQYIHDLRLFSTRMLEYKGDLTVPEHHCLRDAYQLQQTALYIKIKRKNERYV